jgi:DNA mismatch endonuclease (patch repair protein)
MAIRRLVHGMGYRYRLHAKELPGRPDLVFRPSKKAIFVHGCFWHRHPGCSLARLPKSRTDFWIPKLTANRRRDLAHERLLRTGGWKVLIIWECEIDEKRDLKKRIRTFLNA